MAKADKKAKKAKAKKAAPAEPVVAPDQDELLVLAEQFVKKEAKSDPDYKKVKKVVEATTSGRPSRVLMQCQDPQVNGKGDSVCEKTREIAIQDLHQVQRCNACQKRHVQIYRNELARKRRANHQELKGAKKAKAKKAAPAPVKDKKAKKAKKGRRASVAAMEDSQEAYDAVQVETSEA